MYGITNTIATYQQRPAYCIVYHVYGDMSGKPHGVTVTRQSVVETQRLQSEEQVENNHHHQNHMAHDT